MCMESSMPASSEGCAAQCVGLEGIDMQGMHCSVSVHVAVRHIAARLDGGFARPAGKLKRECTVLVVSHDLHELERQVPRHFLGGPATCSRWRRFFDRLQ